MKEEYKSRVYTDRPAYADFEPAAKFEAVKSIIAKRLTQYPNAICSYSGGADSDIMIDLIERIRDFFNLPPVKYMFFNTGLEMKATKDHVKATAEKYGVEIEEVRPKINIVKAAKEHGIPFVSKIMSAGLEGWQKKDIPLSIADEYDQAEDKAAKIRPYEPNVVKAAWYIFGKSYEYRRKYNEYKAERMKETKQAKASANDSAQFTFGGCGKCLK